MLRLQAPLLATPLPPTGGRGGATVEVEMAIRVKAAQALKGVYVPSKQAVELILEPPPREVILRLEVNPADASARDDKFRLFSTDGAYEQKKTIKDDQKPGDDVVDLRFDALSPVKSYSLEHNPGADGEPVFVFENVPYADLVGLSNLEVEEEPAPEKQKLILRLDINPDDADAADDTFRLFSTDGAFEAKKTIKDDKTPGDAFVDLLFEELDPTLSYSLEHDLGAEGGKSLIFEARSYDELIDSSWMVPEDEELEPVKLQVRLDMDPRDARSMDDKVRLFSADGKYEQTKTIKNDTKGGDAWLDLEFTGLLRTGTYSLEVDTGKEGEKYLVFENQPYDVLSDMSWMVPPDEEPEDPDAKDDVIIRIDFDPAEKANLDDKFILVSEDGAIRQVKTVKDDATDGDKVLELQFKELDRTQHYSLLHDDGSGTETPVFEGVAYVEMANVSWMIEGEPDDEEAALPGEFILRVDRDPHDAKAADDKFTLKSTDGAYTKTLTFKDDFTPKDDVLDLKYTALDRTLSYTLEADFGSEEDGGKVVVFEDVPYKELADLSFNAAPSHVAVSED